MVKKKKDENTGETSGNENFDDTSSFSNDFSYKKEIRCEDCKYINGKICRAFPHGIPKQIIDGTFTHDKLYPNQLNKFLFSRKG